MDTHPNHAAHNPNAFDIWFTAMKAAGVPVITEVLTRDSKGKLIKFPVEFHTISRFHRPPTS